MAFVWPGSTVTVGEAFRMMKAERNSLPPYSDYFPVTLISAAEVHGPPLTSDSARRRMY